MDGPQHAPPGPGAARPLRLGIDFDNTIVCYDRLFHRVATEAGLIPPDLPANKSDVRNHLRATGREPVWTEMQGTVYGARMAEADPYPGVHAFFRRCRTAGIPVFIISHKTRRPFLGEPHDLHAAAADWLERQGFHDPDGIGLPRDHVSFELTKADKLARAAACGCTHFIDDLPEILADPAFPAGVQGCLFDPNDLYRAETRFVRLLSWSEADARLLPPPGIVTAPAPVAGDDIDPPLAALFRTAGFPLSETPRIEPLQGGANNRVYTVTGADGRRAVLKRYFHSEHDPRDRFGAEHAFYAACAARQIRRVPRPLAWDPEHRLGLFEFVEGRKLSAGEVDSRHVDEAVSFLTALNAPPHSQAPGLAIPQSPQIPDASEACFSLDEHLDRVSRRVDRLGSMPAITALDREALEFVRGTLRPAWERLRSAVQATQTAGVPGDAPARVSRCLSPSDFGFHNAIVEPFGGVRFLDFEYAGWDDPAKLVCDFFSQPRVPVPLGHWEAFVRPLDQALGGGGHLEARARLLLPVYRIKWCCILLNEFLATDGARRAFAATPGRGAPTDLESRKAVQLAKAGDALASLPTRADGFGPA